MKRHILLLCAWYCITNMHHINAEQDSVKDIHHLLKSDDLETIGDNASVRKIKRIERLSVNCLNVANRLIVNGQEITGNGQVGPAGPAGAPGAAGTFSASYGQLSVTSQTIAPDISWIVIPFTAAGPSSNMTVSTTSPATITILETGIYQLNVSIYFLTAYPADESIYTPVSYLLGLNVNGTTTPVSGVYAGEYNELYELTYSAIMAFNANDTVQFYTEAASDPGFTNRLVLQAGNAYLMQISN